MEQETFKLKELNYDELLEAESKISLVLNKLEADYKSTKDKGGQ